MKTATKPLLKKKVSVPPPPRAVTLEQIIDTIREGRVDHGLRMIVRTVYRRRETLEGVQLIMPSTVDDDTTETSGATTAVHVANEAAPVATTNNAAVQPIPGHDPTLSITWKGNQYRYDPASPYLRVEPCPLRRRIHTPTLRWNGKRYYESRILFQPFLWNANTSAQYKALVGCVVMVTSIPDRGNFKIAVMSRPLSVRTKYYRAWLGDTEVEVSRNIVMRQITAAN